MFTVALVSGGEGYSAFMVVLTVLYYNGLQRSFETLQAPYTRIKAYNRRYPLIHEIHRLGTY